VSLSAGISVYAWLYRPSAKPAFAAHTGGLGGENDKKRQKRCQRIEKAALMRWLTTGNRLKFAHVMNLAALLLISLLPRPADFTPYRVLERASFAIDGTIEAVVVRASGKRPYWHVGIHMAFLEPKNLRLEYDPSIAVLEAKWSRGETFFALVDTPIAATDPTAWIRGRCEFLSSSWPRWLDPFNFVLWQDSAYWWQPPLGLKIVTAANLAS
jgi:hypothetical protein